MTTRRHAQNTAPSARALWLAPVPPSVDVTRAQRAEATQLARDASARVVAEFLYSRDDSGDLGERGWEEVLELAQILHIAALVVVDPEHIARGVAEYHPRVATLEQRGVRLLVRSDRSAA